MCSFLFPIVGRQETWQEYAHTDAPSVAATEGETLDVRLLSFRGQA